ncbi:hypothetical protein D9756_004900 [Leucocoprinus leucothites]|uniref:Dihydroxy-acid/6-phosphogluconate dehydratase N-terminal domain-containing protein n=1 Tax=Leucocoprinus leucothites TaxID=201217 RepID=A0A8H5G9K0_9AGAR|nr:hypothetical protein D9756_004900 [Leucoagaricus leucothites]
MPIPDSDRTNRNLLPSTPISSCPRFPSPSSHHPDSRYHLFPPPTPFLLTNPEPASSAPTRPQGTSIVGAVGMRLLGASIQCRLATRAFSSAAVARGDAVLNRHSRLVTQPKDQGASQASAMLYATDGITTDADFQKAMVGVASVWYEGNPCNKHLLGLGQEIKASLQNANLIGYQFGTVGVSDAISMGTHGMSYSLQSRDLIADSVETAAGGHHLDGMVVVPGCDKNMPGVLMALGRLNRPGLMVYGGTIRAGSCEGAPQLDIVSAFQSYGKFLADGKTPQAEKERYNTVRHACPGPGACGGMYTANTMASAAEALGMTLPGSSSFPAESKEKHDECAAVGATMYNLLENNILPRDIMTRSAFENAMVLTMILGGSTNAVLHLIAMAHSVGLQLTIDDFQRVSDRIPFLADIKPSGKYVMEDVYKIGGIPKVLHFLAKNNLIDGNNMTITGKTLGENLDRWVHKYGELEFEKQDVIRPLDKPIKETGHIRFVVNLSFGFLGFHRLAVASSFTSIPHPPPLNFYLNGGNDGG